MARLWNLQIAQLLKSYHPASFTASDIVQMTGLSFSTVRSSLNLMRGSGMVERDLDIGLGGHQIYRWYWIGGE